MELKVTEIYHDGKAEITRVFHDVTELKEIATHSGTVEPLHEYMSYWYEVWSGDDNDTMENFIKWAKTLPYAQEFLFEEYK